MYGVSGTRAKQMLVVVYIVLLFMCLCFTRVKRMFKCYRPQLASLRRAPTLHGLGGTRKLVYIYIYIYRERERDLDTYIYIYIYIHV